MKQQTLKGQLTRASLLTTLLALLLSAGSLLVYEWFAYRRGWVDDLQTQADLIAHNAEAALEFDDPKTAQDTLRVLRQRPRIRFAAIYTPSGRVFARYKGGNTASDTAADPAFLDGGGYRFSGDSLEVAYPIERDQARVGTVYLRAAHDVTRRLLTYGAIELAVMAAAMAIALVVFGRLQRAITAPLLATTAVARKVIARRDWKLRAPGTANADLALLVDAFNRMLDEVEANTGELERAVAERLRVEGELRDADRRKDEFLATLGHELRNPLAPMTNAVTLLRMPRANAALHDKALEILDRQLRQVTRLIDDLLDVSRITTGKLLLSKEPLDLVALLRSVADTTEPLAAQHDLTLHTELPAEPCRVMGDAARLSQVFSNLLANALRYTPAGGQVTLRMRCLPDTAEVQVVDTGIGVPAALQERIFELFEQGDKRLERGNTGLGIGLTLARQLARLHGGDISVHSEGEGRGSTFTVLLPRPAPSAADAGEVQHREAVAAAPRRVLLADDNVDFATSLQDLMLAQGHEVRMVHDGEAAVTAALDDPPDVAVLDIGMPKLNGYEVARRLRENPRTAGLRLIAVTGWGQATDKRTAAEAGFDHHLVKPVRTDVLLSLLAPAEPAA